jgi:hypothetical protein
MTPCERRTRSSVCRALAPGSETTKPRPREHIGYRKPILFACNATWVIGWRYERPPSGIGWYIFSLFGFPSRMICLYPSVHFNPSILALIVRKKWASLMSRDDLMHAGCMDLCAGDSELRYILAAKQKLVSYRINKKHNQTWAHVRV